MLSNSNLNPGTDASSLHCVGGKSSVFGDFYFMEQEKWKPVVGFETSYEVSSLGRIKSLRSIFRYGEPIIRKLQINRTGYPVVSFCYTVKKEERNKYSYKTLLFSVHRLVAIAFIPNPENKPSVNHVNGIKTDNRVENLEWCTDQENKNHANNIGLRKDRQGEAVTGAKLKESQVEEIIKSPLLTGILAKQYMVSNNTIRLIRGGKIWKYLYKKIKGVASETI